MTTHTTEARNTRLIRGTRVILHGGAQVTVIDFPNEEQVRLSYPSGATTIAYTDEDRYNDIADQIEEQTKPPRIPEPGWSGVVEAGVRQHDERLHWQRDSGTHEAHWVCQNVNEYDRKWEDLVDPVLVRHGIEDAS
jgi:hypothetical protein